jgi:hypothetical protein
MGMGKGREGSNRGFTYLLYISKKDRLCDFTVNAGGHFRHEGPSQVRCAAKFAQASSHRNGNQVALAFPFLRWAASPAQQLRFIQVDEKKRGYPAQYKLQLKWILLPSHDDFFLKKRLKKLNSKRVLF